MNRSYHKPKHVSQLNAQDTTTHSMFLSNSKPLRDVVKGAATSHNETVKPAGSNGTQSGKSVFADNSKTVMVVDDDVMVNELTSQLLERFGYSVCTAFSGEEALGLYRGKNDAIDLVMLDLSMPGMGGYDCLRELVRFDPTVRVIITSGYSDDEKKQATLKAGAAGFVGKPYQTAELIKTVNTVLEVGNILENQD